jgi:hypothetical protein
MLNLKCHFCKDNHTSRSCKIEKEIAPILKKKIGELMEHYVADNFKCPNCNNCNSMKVIGNHLPSLDIVCNLCSKKIEVKSKCLSVYNLPNDIVISHGNYDEFINRINQDLDLIVIIYGVNRKKKLITIREGLYIPCKILKDNSLVSINKRNNSTLSTIVIADRSKLSVLNIPLNNSFNFYKDIQQYLS